MTCILYHFYPNNIFPNKYFMYTFMMTPLTTHQYKDYNYHLYSSLFTSSYVCPIQHTMFGKLSDGTSVRSAVVLLRQQEFPYHPKIYLSTPLVLVSPVKAQGSASFKCPGDGYKIVRDQCSGTYLWWWIDMCKNNSIYCYQHCGIKCIVHSMIY